MSLLRALYEAHHVPGTIPYQVTQVGIWFLVLLSILGLTVELALEPLPEATAVFLALLDRAILVLFSAELVSRVLTYRPPDLTLLDGNRLWRLKTHLWGRLRYLATPLVALDLLTVLAFMPALRGLRALRLLRLLAGVRFFPYANPILGVLRAFAESWLLYASTLGFLALIIIIGGLSLYLLEARANPQVLLPSDGIWWALVTVTTVGFGDITPVTTGGRLVASGVMVVGMFTVALFAGIVTTTLLGVLVRLRAEQFRMSGHAHHLIVCGYEPVARQLLDCLLDEEQAAVGARRELILFGSGGRPTDVPADFTWVEGDPTRESQLSKVRPEFADAVIIMGRRSQPPQEADASTILTIFTLRRYLATRPRPRRERLNVIAEILDNENVDHARTAGADEVIETTRLGYSMMAHSVNAPGSGAVLSRVASASAASVYVGRAPITEIQNYGAVARRMLEEHGITVLGVSDLESGELVLSPSNSVTVAPEDGLIYLATEAKLKPA